ncbi:MAG: FliM/FliN family flagellar motor switch protein [Verrucomicrobiales bacterium]|nr:FliM/FliN family flagellar motor switch protein [Verrucomicrobiales bacterium]
MSAPSDPLANGPEVLSQSEVERLLSQVHEQETTTTVFGPQGQPARYRSEDIQPFDFRQPAFLAPSELRRIRLRHEDFIRTLAADLSIYLRVEFGLRMAKLQTLSYQKLVDNLPNPSHLTLFKAEPLKGICLLDLHPHLGLTIVDRLLGGPGHSVHASRDLSDLETALLDEVVHLILNDWCNQWQKLQDLRPVVLGHETTPRFLHTAAHDTVMLVLSLEASLGDCLEPIQLAFPYFTLEPLVRQLASLTTPEKDVGTATTGQPRWRPDYNDIPVSITAEWRNLEIPVRSLAQLRPGDLLALEPECFEQVVVSLAGQPKFHGRLGTRDTRWAVELTAPLPP